VTHDVIQMMILYIGIIGIGTWAWGDKSYWNYDPR
jgi:hypothetical protein